MYQKEIETNTLAKREHDATLKLNAADRRKAQAAERKRRKQG